MDAIGDHESGIRLAEEEALSLDGEFPIDCFHVQRSSGTNRSFALIIKALGSFRVEFALAGQAEGAPFGFGDQISPVWLAIRLGAFQHRLHLGIVRRRVILGDLEPSRVHNGLCAPGLRE